MFKALSELYGDTFIEPFLIITNKFLHDMDQKESIKLMTNYLEQNNLNDNSIQKFVKDLDKEKLINFIKLSEFEIQTSKEFKIKKKEAALFLVGQFTQDIIIFQNQFSSSFDLTSFLDYLIDDFKDQEVALLKGRALWTIDKFCEIVGAKFKEYFIPLFELAYTCLDKSNLLSIRLLATKSLTLYANKIIKFNLLQEYGDDEDIKSCLSNKQIINDLFDILNYCDQYTLPLILKAFVAINKITPSFVIQEATYGAQHFLRIFQLFNANNILGSLILKLLEQLCDNKDAFQTIYKVFAPFIFNCFNLFKNTAQNNPQFKELLKESDIKLLTSTMDIIALFLKTNKDNKIKQSIIVLLEPLVDFLFLNSDNYLQQNATKCLKYFIIYGHEEIIKMNLSNQVYRAISHLVSDKVEEAATLYLGNLILLTFNNLAEGNLNLEILQALVNKIYKSRMPSTIQGLVLVFAKMFNTNTKETINFLTSFSIENRFAFKVILDKWLLFQPLFRGQYLKNATYLALSKIFKEKDQRIEALLTIGYNPSHQNLTSDEHKDIQIPFKIFSILIRCLDNETQITKQKQNEYSTSVGEQSYNEEQETDQQDDDDEIDENVREQYQTPNKFNMDNLQDISNSDNKIFDSNQKQESPIQVNIEQLKDDEDIDIAKRFDTQKKERKGLSGIEVQSEQYQSEMLEFEMEDNEECDETTEEDLLYMKDISTSFQLIDMLKQFFNDIINNDNDYFQSCLKVLLKDDINKLKRYVKFQEN